MTYLDKICRACLNVKESFKYVLFDNVSPELYSFCTSVEVYQNENLPKTICDSCYDILTKFFNFKQTCIKSQNTLLECKNNVKTENVTDLRDVDIGIQENDDHDYESGFEPEAIKMEQNVDKLIDDDYNDIRTDNAITDNDSSSCNRKKKKKGSKKLQEMSSKHLIENSVSKINLTCKGKRRKLILICKICKRSYSLPERYEAHKLEHEGKKVTIRCPVCDKIFVTWSGLFRHKARHTHLERFKCRTCGKEFKTRNTLRMHRDTHKERKFCICDVCGKNFLSLSSLKNHLEIHNESREKKYECGECGKKFYANPNLRSHISKHHRERKKFICQICSFPFTDKYCLIKHLRLHEGLKLFKCDICEKSYARKIALIEHKRVHSGERPFTCTDCPKSFPTKQRLNEHYRTHTGEKPHKCVVCNQSFSQRGTMKRHMKVHDKLPTTHI
ncbi:PREDICTED: zinc finger protein 501-like [Papilio xuthus]|uniref:Zinc finger protein 501-like n=1 Tax=Papilio xuthus TaxID=66420 RepID=A0AAJ6ZQA4_PAPXU|nr:PREDICTED: zinc finger protein 501-like [Papilio xuthus]